ncbi:hypothetical protein GIB67_007983, partial [Kingdonia uniflora]
MNEKYENMNDDKEVLKNQHKKLRNIYTILKAFLGQSGFGWDDEKHMVTADSYVWDKYLKEHPKAKPMRTKTMPNYHDLDEIYDTAVEDDSPLINNKVEKTKKNRSTSEGMIDALKSIASEVDGMKNRRSEIEKKPNVIEVLGAIFGLLEGDYLKACDLLK